MCKPAKRKFRKLYKFFCGYILLSFLTQVIFPPQVSAQMMATAPLAVNVPLVVPLPQILSINSIPMDAVLPVLERPVGVTDPRTGTTTTSYNPTTGRVDYVQDPATNRVSYTYETTTGRKATETNALNQATRFAYNNLDQVTNTWGDVPYPVEYVYDAYGRISKMRTWRTSAAWNGTTWPSGVSGQEDVTTWNYQEATGLLTSKTDDAGQSTAYTYTTGGKLLTRTWARSGGTIVTTYGYDPNTAELLSVNYSDTTPDMTFTYNRSGQQNTIADALGSRTFGYNTALQPTTETISGLYNKTITRTYETTGVIGRSAGLNTGADYSVSYGYDPTGRFNSTGWNVNGVTGSATYTYVPNSDLLGSLSTASGQATAYTYEPNRNLRTRINNQFNAGVVSQYDYVYDALGRRTSVANTGSAFSAAAFNRFAYNGRSELNESARYLGTDVNVLTSPVTPEYRGFAYDPIGNRTNITVATNPGTYTTNNLNQYSLANLPAGGSNTFTHDLDGNLTAISGTKNVTYTYNAENRLITAQPTTPVVNDKKVDSLYDYQGRRVRKVVSNWTGLSWALESTKYFVYDGWNVVEEQTVAQPSKYYVWGLDLSQSLQGAGGIGGLIVRVESATTHHFLHDGNGNVGQLVNAATGSIDAHYEYDPYGNTIMATGIAAPTNPYRFSAKYLDVESGLYYYGHRYYDPQTGRWLSRDPIEELGFETLNSAVSRSGLVGSLNNYAFNENDPVDSFDILGLAFYAVGGTWERASDNANAWYMYQETKEQPREYFRGPGFTFNIKNPILASHGRDSLLKARLVKAQICADFCKEKGHCKNLEINMTGWSRGATIAMGVAKMLNNEGCRCGGFLGFGSKRYAPVEVNWIGLFDAVEQVFFEFHRILPGDQGFPGTVPGNVKSFAHAIKTKKQFIEDRLIFPTTRFGRNERAFYQKDGITPTTHGDIGTSRTNNDAYDWIKSEAIKAGVDF